VLYFDAYNGVNGEELWQSDGTTAGTQMIEIVPGSGSSTPVGLTSIGTRLYFSAVDDVAGRELWKADPPVPSPDFVITAVTLNPATSALNGTFAATVTVKNQGNLAGDGKFLDVWSHQPTAQPCAATGTARQSVGTLAAGASKVLTFSALNAGTVAGMKMFRAFVDSGCGTAESNNANNQFIKVYPVNQPTATADLTVTNVVINTAAPVANGVITATVTVKNQGTTTADGKNLEVWSHQPTAQACGAIGNARQTVGSLAVGVSKTLTFSGLPAGIAGAKTLRAYVDSGCGTTETNEDNNQLTKAYTVQ
jgi:ELWxxDGT repeat protein